MIRPVLAVVILALTMTASSVGPALAASTPGGALSGVVRDQTGAVQAHAEVVLVSPSGTTVGSTTTGSSGRYSFTVTPGAYDLGVVTTDATLRRVARVRGVDVGVKTTLDLVVLPPYATLSGTIRDASGAPLRLHGRVYLGGEQSDIGDNGQYSLRALPGTYPLSITVTDDNTETYLDAGIKAFTLTDDRVQDLTFAVTTLTIDGRDERGQPVAVAAANVYSPFDCTCPAGFEFFPGSGQATGYWRSFRHSGTVLALPGDTVVTASPADPNLVQVTAQRFTAPWPNPLPIVMKDAPPPSEAPPPPVTVTWKGTVRHNGVPVEADVNGYGTGADGHFELQFTPGHQRFELSAYIGSSYAEDSGGPPPGLHIDVPDFEITADRTMDIDIPTADLAVHVVDEAGNPVSALVTGTSGGNPSQGGGAPVQIFPGGRGEGRLENYLDTDATGNATLLMFPGSPPVVGASAGYAGGSATPAPSARSVTVQIRDQTLILSGTVRDARGPLPVVNWPWVSFSGPASRNQQFDGDHLGPTGAYQLHDMAGKHTLTITDQPDFDEDNTDNYVANPTLPKVWSITTDLTLAHSTTLDLTIPDASPAHFRAVDADGQPLASSFTAASDHTVTLAAGVTGSAHAESHDTSTQGRFDHMLFDAAATAGSIGLVGGFWSFTLPRLAPGDDVVLAVSSTYTGGDIVPAATTTTTAPPTTTKTTTTTTTHPPSNPGVTTATTPEPAKTGYWTLSADGHVYNFGDAAALGNAAGGAVDLAPTPTGMGYWTLNKNGTVTAFGDALPFGNVNTTTLANGEEPASLSATPTGNGYWIFTNKGRAQAFGDATFLGDMSGTRLNGPVLGSVATPTGRGYYMVASDGGIFAFGDAAFAGSMGGKKLNAPVQSLVPDGDGSGYWLVASDGGIFAFDAPFRGSMGGTKLNKPISGMVPYGDGYLMVGADGGIFNFSTSPFAGSLGDKPPAAPVVAVAALPSI